ncbi:MAG: DNA primase, partial [Paludibacteraceae bacterium]|nr:DNA primase [Paludibacteraceae bacterium]
MDRIHAAAKIEEVVADYVTLRKRGANLIGLCPFHNEKTGSFTVSPSKGIYKCFGCGVSGNAVGFIMEIEQCSYVDALKQLGKKYHIEVPEREMTAEEQQRQDNRESMFVVNDFANKWFQKQLWETQEGQAIGLGYFRERGLRDDIIRKYQLGYSPEKGSPLAKELQKQGFKEEFITNNVDTKIGVG